MMTHDEMLEHIIGKIDKLDEKLDAFRSEVGQDRVHVEHRLTSVEHRATFFGSVGGVVGGFLASLFGRQ